jgi:hypothetical protein
MHTFSDANSQAVNGQVVHGHTVNGAIGFPGLVIYPSVPWLGIMCLGYGLGSVLQKDPVQRNRALSWLGLGALTSFPLLRTLGGYGDPQNRQSYDTITHCLEWPGVFRPSTTLTS